MGAKLALRGGPIFTPQTPWSWRVKSEGTKFGAKTALLDSDIFYSLDPGVFGVLAVTLQIFQQIFFDPFRPLVFE